MPWKECSVMDERIRFVGRLLDGEGMSDVCRAFGISRKTGYKIWGRYRQEGLEALTDRSRRPVRYANQLPEPDIQLDRADPIFVRIHELPPLIVQVFVRIPPGSLLGGNQHAHLRPEVQTPS